VLTSLLLLFLSENVSLVVAVQRQQSVQCLLSDRTSFNNSNSLELIAIALPNYTVISDCANRGCCAIEKRGEKVTKLSIFNIESCCCWSVVFGAKYLKALSCEVVQM